VPTSAPALVALGCYTSETGGRGPGVALARVTHSGLEIIDTAAVPSPSFLARHPRLPLLYAVSELDEGRLVTLSFEGEELLVLDDRPTGGSLPCHVSVLPDGSALVVAQYGSGSVAGWPLGVDGLPVGAGNVLQHNGSGPHPDRQTSPHVHQATVAPTGEVTVCDLGTDTITSYRVADGQLERRHVSTAPPGSGPRHLALSEDGETAYVTAELDNGLLWFERDGDGPWSLRYRVPATGPRPVDGPNLPSHLAFTPDENYLLVANRGADVISVFDVGGGEPIFVGDVDAGVEPRHFQLIGDLLLVAAQSGDEIRMLRMDLDRGSLALLGTLPIGTPSCVLPL
jgi:6-phosphogluconolactonase